MKLEFVILEGPQAGRHLPLGDTPVTFGRSPTANQSFPQDTFMSGAHLTARAAPQGVALTDMRSTNGSFLNGQRITQALAAVGDIVKIGSLTMRVAAIPVATTGVVLSSPIVTAVVPKLVTASGSPPAIAPAASKIDTILQVLQRDQEQLFCLLDAATDESILSLLALAHGQMPIQSLYEGESAVNLARWAPYLLQFPRDSALLRVLVDKGWGKGWASYFTAAAPFEDVRKHFRKFLMVQIEQGREVYFRFYDPRVLRDFLPTANNGELSMFFGPVSEWTVEASDSNELLTLRRGPEGLMTSVLSLSKNPLATQSIRAPGG